MVVGCRLGKVKQFVINAREEYRLLLHFCLSFVHANVGQVEIYILNMDLHSNSNIAFGLWE